MAPSSSRVEGSPTAQEGDYASPTVYLADSAAADAKRMWREVLEEVLADDEWRAAHELVLGSDAAQPSTGLVAVARVAVMHCLAPDGAWPEAGPRSHGPKSFRAYEAAAGDSGLKAISWLCRGKAGPSGLQAAAPPLPSSEGRV